MQTPHCHVFIRFGGLIGSGERFTLEQLDTQPTLGGSWFCELKRFEGNEQERPDSFVLTWSSTKQFEAELFAVELITASSKTVLWRYPIFREMKGPAGTVDFRGIIPSSLWKKTFSVTTPISSLDTYSRNDTAFVFPSVNKVLWAIKADLVEASEYFSDMLEESDFEEATVKVDAPNIEQTLLQSAAPKPASAVSTTAVPSASSATRDAGGELVNTSAGLNNGDQEAATEAKSASDNLPLLDEDSDDEEENPPAPSSATRQFIHRVVIRDTPYKTYRAMLYFVVSGKISFAHLSSLYPSSRRPPSSRSASTANLGTPVSPKSMYRLADFLALRDLRGLAFASLESQLCANNCLAELLSDLAADYDDVREACIAAVLRHWPALVEAGEIEELGRKVVEGELEPRKARIAWDVMSRLKPVA
ncbi:hypothetical protein JCM8097_000585 [Rhodosporidiobolus ruineniae]